MRFFLLTCFIASVFFIPAALFIPATGALAATLHLTNGDRLSGQISQDEDDDTIRIQTGFGSILRIPESKVARIDYESPAAATQNAAPPNMNVVDNALLTRTPIIRAPVSSPSAAPQRAQVKKQSRTGSPDARAIPEQEGPIPQPEESFKWSGRINFGATLQSGNTDQTALNTDGKAKAEKGSHRFGVSAEINSEEDEGETTVDNRSLSGYYDYFFEKHWFSNTTIGFKQDDIDELDLRSRVGQGIGYQPYNNDGLSLKFILGGTYLREEFDNTDTETSLAAKWETDYEQRFFNGLIQAFHQHELFVPTDDTGAFILETESGVRTPFKMGLVGTAEIDFDWDNDPAPGVIEDDTIYSLKLGYEW